ncbi:MAG: bifunctional folylpolyglutamate synthase/dihydrofolate synthase [Bacteroidales bacterium]|jgi:dihydrofolate synthase/folylpolyglutamate synthase|nr:bifunctional folylpolyglutamate synthase/dihydrofolate synthase [Bacteroidales bacterium]
MTYLQTIDYLFAQLPMYHRVGASAYKADLNNTIALCDLLGNPHHSFKTIHVTGTNGKGSVSHMLASILQTSGVRTGLYTSPHLKDFRERIRVDGRMIDKQYVTSFIGKYRKKFEKIQPSFFELTVGMAFQYFRDRDVDVAVIEAGLGGRLDSTNIITPVLSVITNISFDHMQFLGNTLEKIATEKAGIIKTDIPVVIGETQSDTEEVFRHKAQSCNSPVFFADALFTAVNTHAEGRDKSRRLVLDITRMGTPYLPNLHSPLTGNYQRKNIITVMGVCEGLNSLGFDLSPAIIRTGIKNVIRKTGLAGRWQIIGLDPLTICDTGHNEGGLKEVVAQIAATPFDHLHFVIGMVNDKHLAPILKILPKDATYYYCKPDIPRGLVAETLEKSAIRAGLHGLVYPSVKAAYEAARKAAFSKDLVFVGGSNFVVAEVI